MSFKQTKNIGFTLIIVVLIIVGLIPSYITNRIEVFNTAFLNKLDELGLATELQETFWNASVLFSESIHGSNDDFGDIIALLNHAHKISNDLETGITKGGSGSVDTYLEELNRSIKRFKIAILHYQREYSIDPSADNTAQLEQIALNTQRQANGVFTKFYTSQISEVKSNQSLISKAIESSKTVSLGGLLIGTVICILAAILVGRAINRPILKLLEGTEKIANGDLSTRVDDSDSDEIGHLASSFNKMSEKLNTSFDKHKVLLRDAKRAAESEKKKSLELFSTIEKLNQEIQARESIQKQLIIAKQVADASNHAKSEFLANMSHELRTPLNHIIGFTEIVIDQHVGDLNEAQVDYLKDVHSSSHHLLNLINDILDLSKVESGKLELVLADVPIKDILNNSLTMFKEQSLKHNIQLALDLAGIPDVLRADERKIKQVIFNLLSNAVKFTPDGGQVTLAARTCDTNGTDEKCVQISVTDTGIGIDPENLARIFNPFEQVEQSASRRFQGTGLGLSLTKQIVELHGGTVWADSKGAGMGSIFYLTIPL